LRAAIFGAISVPLLSAAGIPEVLFEDNFESADWEPPSVRKNGCYVIYKAERITLPDKPPGSGSEKGNALRLDRSALRMTGHRRVIGQFDRPAVSGEHLRLEFDLCVENGSALQFGISSRDGGIPAGKGLFLAAIVSFSESGAVSVYDGSRHNRVPGISLSSGKWQRCSLDFQAGSDHLILSIGTERAVVQGPFAAGVESINRVDGFFVSTAADEVSGTFDNIRAAIVENPALAKLPVFGKITWTQSAMPFIRKGPKGGISGVGMCDAGNRICVAGGFLGKEALGDGSGALNGKTSKWAYAYNPENQDWTQLPDLPKRAEYGRMTAHGDKLYFLGGAAYDLREQGLGPYNPSAGMVSLRLDKADDGWRTEPPMKEPRTHFALGNTGQLFIAAGGNVYDDAENGYSQKTLRNLTEIFDPSEPAKGWQLGSPMPPPARGWTASVGAGGRLWVFGGVTFEPSGKKKSLRRRLSETLSYDPVTDAWTRHAPAPLEISGWGAAAYSDRYIILVGGYGSVPGQPPEMNAQPLVYDIQQDRWMRFAHSALPPAGAFNDPGVAISGNSLYVGGGEGYGGSHYNHWLIGQIEEHP